MNQNLRMFFFLAVGCCAVLSNACSQQMVSQGNNSELDERPVAFPGAEGFGKYSTGGRGGTVFIVTNLNDSGPGSFREAVTYKGKRIVVFEVSGTIHLESKLNIASDVTIAGQTSPGDGICIADHPVVLNGDNIVVRYLRFRMGDRYQNKGMADGSGSDDALSSTRKKNIVVDHCSLSWSTDEVLSIYAGDSTTIQWNIISEPLNYSYHFETGDKDFERHGYGGIWGGQHLSAHHNLFAHCNSRTPRFDGIRNSPVENVDLRNNVIYNWGGNNVYAGEGGNYNIVNNYYKAGPATNQNVRYRVANPFDRKPDIPFGRYYIAGNYVDGSPSVTNDNWSGVKFEKGSAEDAVRSKLEKPFPAVDIRAQDAREAYQQVLERVGANLPKRDTLDARIINDVINKTGRLIDVQGGFTHGTPYAETVNAWPTLKSVPALKDTDRDGIPDDWERTNRLDPNNSSDATRFSISKEYTNIEVYINKLAKS